MGRRARWLAPLLACGALLAIAGPAPAHVERASYWPDPGAEDVGAGRTAGGIVPEYRDLFTALDKSAVGDTRIVCQGTVPKSPKKKIKKLKKKIQKLKKKKEKKVTGKALKRKVKKLNKRYNKKVNANPSIQALNASIKAAKAGGFKLRASQPALPFTKHDGKQFRKLNRKLLANCGYHEIQPAVTDSHNNDRVVVMPGVYTEPTSRAAPAQDPRCADLVETNDHGTTGALSYKYQAACPNDQNLIAVIGRTPGDTPPPQPPALDRHGIPDTGPCIRCNVQIEGSGIRPEDVTIDGGDPALGDHSPSGDDPPDYAKDVGIRLDRADGSVIRNLKTRHFNEHGIYATETDGNHIDRVKMSYNSEYGYLSFVADHTLVENCDAWGSGDAAVYPGATADVGDAVPAEQRRYGTEMRNCDAHHSAAGFSGTDSNAVWIHHVNFYDNTLGYTTDVFTAPGHPGFPQDSNLVENNNFYDNNFNLYLPPCGPGESPGPPEPGQNMDNPGGNCSDVVPTVPEPVGTGLWIAGGNHNIVRNNRFWNNWRRGTMTFAVPDALVCGPAGAVAESLLAGCSIAGLSTSYRNEFYGNKMGVALDGGRHPNGTDFWWDSFIGNTGNCWHDNTGVNGDRASLTTMPALGPVPGASIPTFLPEACDSTSIGLVVGNPLAEPELLGCLAAFDQDLPIPCDWFTTPARP